jgi:hypothetical protein
MKSNHDFSKIQKRILRCEKILLEKHPGSSYTTHVLLWDDKTSLVKCIHGDEEKLYIVTSYKNKYHYEETPLLSNAVILDKVGREYFVETFNS